MTIYNGTGVLLYASSTGSNFDIPLNYALPWDIGRNYPYHWIAYIVVLLFGFTLNGVTLLFLLFNNNIKKLDTVPVVQYLVAEDFSFSLVCLIQCSLNYHHHSQFGASPGCIFMAWQIDWFITITSCSLCLIAFTLRQRVTSIVPVKNPPIFRLHLCFWSVGALFAIGATVWPGSSRMVVSGTFCVPAFERPWPGVFFFGLSIFPCSLFLMVQYTWIVVFYYAKVSSPDQSKRKIRFARQLGAFVFAYFFFYVPFLCAALYEWITGYFASEAFDFVCGIFTHLASVANPVLYVLVTTQFQNEIRRLMGITTSKEMKRTDVAGSGSNQLVNVEILNPEQQ